MRGSSSTRCAVSEEAGFESDKVLLCGDGKAGSHKATPPILRDILQNKLECAQNADNLWFFFSGHGLAGDDQQDYLLTIGSNPSDLKVTAISTHFVADQLRACKAKNIGLILDMCRTENRDFERKNVELQREKQQGMITMYCCDRDQSSYEISDLKQGAFTYALLQGLREKVLVRDLALYLESRVPELHRSVGKSQRVQVPRIIPDPGWKYEQPILMTLIPEVDIAVLKDQTIDSRYFIPSNNDSIKLNIRKKSDKEYIYLSYLESNFLKLLVLFNIRQK